MNPAQTEAADVLARWKATYAEIFPHRDPDSMRVDDASLALAVMLTREEKDAGSSNERPKRPSFSRIIHGPGISPGRDPE